MSNVTVSDWSASINSEDGMLAVSCTVTAEGCELAGVGIVANDAGGRTIATCYISLTGEASSAAAGINVPSGGIADGDTILIAANGECGGQHFFEEKRVTVGAA